MKAVMAIVIVVLSVYLLSGCYEIYARGTSCLDSPLLPVKQNRPLALKACVILGWMFAPQINRLRTRMYYRSLERAVRRHSYPGE